MQLEQKCLARARKQEQILLRGWAEVRNMPAA